jgi:hypothetical protein
MELTNSKRVLLKASYVQAELSEEEQQRIDSDGGSHRALEKINYIRNLDIDDTELRELAHRFPHDHELVTLLQEYGHDWDHRQASQRFGEIAASAYMQLGDVLTTLRDDPATEYAVSAFAQKARIAPVGRLHLERIEMYPAGTEQGEMIFTVPMTPRETVTISHKEWATSKDEYDQIVSDYFESYSERGVVDKTDASISTENENRHSSSFNFGSSVTGGYGPVSATVSVGLANSSEDRAAAKESIQNTRETTQKASARTRQEHKVSVKLESSHGTDDTSFRTITNPFDDRAIRVDYYRMMRKWRVDLYRYGLRLTFDIAVPNPGARLWARHRELVALDTRIQEAFSFSLTEDQITETNWPALSKQFGVAVEAPPPPTTQVPYSHRYEANKDVDGPIEFVAPPGYDMTNEFKGTIEYWGPAGIPEMIWPDPGSMSSQLTQSSPGVGIIHVAGKGVAGREKLMVPFMRTNQYTVQVALVAGARRAVKTFTDWQLKAWTAFRDAEFARYQAEHALLQEQRDQLWLLLSGKDTLSLRRLERDELMRCVLTWLIGPNFETAPNDVGQIIKFAMDSDSDALDKPDDQPQPNRTLTPTQWGTVSGFGDLVKFVHHAVEWENLLYFLYPYFWGSDDLARQKLLFEHGDAGHRDFLRAGYARVVVPIRPGFEESFTQLIDTGSPGGSSPYVTIAEEVAAFAHTNYAGIPPANPEHHARPLLYPQQRSTWETMETVIAAIEAYQQANGKYPEMLSDLPGPGSHLDAWNNELHYVCPGSGNDYDLISFGADGKEGGAGIDADISAGAGASLMASWFDYTPTSGIDIDIQSVSVPGGAAGPTSAGTGSGGLDKIFGPGATGWIVGIIGAVAVIVGLLLTFAR